MTQTIPGASWRCDDCGWLHIDCDYLTKCDGCKKPRKRVPTDTERLDWLEHHDEDLGALWNITRCAEGTLLDQSLRKGHPSLRAAIDAAMQREEGGE